MTVKKKRLKLNKFLFFYPLFAFVVLLFLIVVLPFSKKIYPNVYVAGVYLGGLTKNEAVETLNRAEIKNSLNLVFDEQKEEMSVQDIIKNIDYSKTVDRVFNYTNGEGFLNNTLNKLKLIFKPVDFSLYMVFDDNSLNEKILILSDKYTNSPVLPTIKRGKTDFIVTNGVDGETIDEKETSNEIKNNLSNLNFSDINVNRMQTKGRLSEEELNIYKQRVNKLFDKEIDFGDVVLNDTLLVSFIDPFGMYYQNAIQEEIKNISRKVNQNPQDSVFIVQNEKVEEFVPSKNGVTVIEKDLLNTIMSTLDELSASEAGVIKREIPTVKTEAKIKNEDVNNLGIKTLLGKGYSTFKGSIPNRIYNINLAQSRFKGVLVPPEETFSFVEVLGDVSSLTGYKSAYVIKDGKTVLGDGGGVCQVSTTLFRAILDAGLPVVERRAHSYRVGYYEQGYPPGLDATVFYPTTDLKFRNNTENYLLIQPTIDLSVPSLTFEIYGTDDGRIATTSKPVTTSSTAPPEDLYVDDPTLPIGTVKQIEHKAWGARVVFKYHVEKDGETLTDQTFVSNYQPWQAVYLRGVEQ